MSFFRMIRDDNMLLTAGLFAVGVILAFVTIISRLSSCEPPTSEPKTDFRFKVKQISFVALRKSMVEVQLRLPSLPKYSENWQGDPQLKINWSISTRANEKYSGQTMALFRPPYDSFIFSLQDTLEEELTKSHSERMFINEYRFRIIRAITSLHVDIMHPETDEILDSFTQPYDPEQRKEETWALD